MKIRASTRSRKGSIDDEKGVGYLALTAECDEDREFITSVYRIAGGDTDLEAKGIAWMRNFLKLFPPSKQIRE